VIVRTIFFLEGISLRKIYETKSVEAIHKNHKRIERESQRFLITTSDKNQDSHPRAQIILYFQNAKGAHFSSLN